jgi:transcription initiation factor TFIID subunit 11
MKRGREESEDEIEGDLDLSEFEEEETKVDEEQIRLHSILSSASPDQYKRYSVMHSTYFYNLGTGDAKNEKFEKIIKAVTSANPSKKLASAVAISAKIFIGELVETALQVAAEHNQPGPLQPWHLKEARRRLKRKGVKS